VLCLIYRHVLPTKVKTKAAQRIEPDMPASLLTRADEANE
jgi:hypothetical protein